MPQLGCRNLTRRLACRELYGHRPGAAANSARQLYDVLTPNTAVSQCDLPEAHICKFSPDGQYLVCFASAFQQLVVYRFTGHTRATNTRIEQQQPQVQCEAQEQQQQQQQAGDVPVQAAPTTFRRIPSLTGLVKADAAAASGRPSQFKDFFSLQYRSTVCTGPALLARDCALFPLAGTSPVPLLLLASHTHLVDPTRTQQGAGTAGTGTAGTGATPPPAAPRLPAAQVPSVPYVEKTTLHLLNLATGQQLDSVVLEHDWVPLGGGAGISLLGDMLAITAVRSQQVLLVQVRRSGSLMPVLQLGPWCREDDQLTVAQAQAAEQRWRQQQLLKDTHGQKRHREEEEAASDMRAMRHRLTDSGARAPQPHPGSVPGSRLWPTGPAQRPITPDPTARVASPGITPHTQANGILAHAGTGSPPARPQAHFVLLPPEVPADQLSPANGETAAMPSQGSAQASGEPPARRHNSIDHQVPPLQHEHTRPAHNQDAYQEGPIQSRLDPLIAGQNAAGQFPQLPGVPGLATRAYTHSRPPPTVVRGAHPQPPPPIAVQGVQGARHGANHLGPAGTARLENLPTGQGHTRAAAPLVQEPGQPVPHAAGHASMLFVSGTAANLQGSAAMPEDGNGRDGVGDMSTCQPIVGLKQRLLAHRMMSCLHAAKASSGPSRTARAAAKRAALHNFYAEFETLCNLIVCRAQLVEPDLLLLDLGAPTGPAEAGSMPGAAAGPAPTGTPHGPQQSQYIALYSWRSARVRAFLTSTSDAAIALLLRYAPLLGSDAGGCGLDRFGHTGLHVRMCQELLAGLLPEPASPHASTADKSDRAQHETSHGLNGRSDQHPNHEAGPVWAVYAAGGPAGNQVARVVDRPADRLTTVKRVLSLLPGGCQVVSSSPLLDWRLFSYDEKLLLPLARVRPAPDQTIRFYSTSRPESVAFKLEPGAFESAGPAPPGRQARHVMLPLFHPVVPFAMLVGSSVMGPQASLSLQYRL